MLFQEFTKMTNVLSITGRVPFVVTDTEAKMNKFGIALFKAPHFSEHVYCIDHTLQLVAVIAYKAIITGDDNDDYDFDEECEEDDDDDGGGEYDEDEVRNSQHTCPFSFNETTLSAVPSDSLDIVALLHRLLLFRRTICMQPLADQ